jgi:hypothetical protein
MMPELTALFNEPRRLWAGVGTKIRGYADKKTITGVQSSGAPDAFTLGRSDSSAPMPDQGTGENPVELRAGSGCRLHGYGGIHTLERLPLPPTPEETKPRVASFVVEHQPSRGGSTVCLVAVMDPIENGYVTKRTFLNEFENGSYSIIQQASGYITSYPPGEGYSCEIEESNTIDDDTEYGDFISETISDVTASWSSARATAISNLNYGETIYNYGYSYPEEQWEQISSQNSNLYITGYWSQSSFYNPGWDVLSGRWRITNTGQCPIKIKYAYPLSTATPPYATDGTLEVGQKSQSDWIVAPLPSPETGTTLYLTRVQLGRWRTTA